MSGKSLQTVLKQLRIEAAMNPRGAAQILVIDLESSDDSFVKDLILTLMDRNDVEWSLEG